MAQKPECKYGSNCYRKNKEHLEKFQHPTKRQNFQEENEEEERAEKRPKLDDEENEQGSKQMDEVEGETLVGEEQVERDEATEEEEESAQPAELDIKEELRSKFKVQMPQDFFDLWDYCKSCNPKDPCAALVEDLGLQLGGPYDVMSGKLKQVDGKKPDYLLHHRYFYDPPEFQTVLVGDQKTQYHLGYYRDEPQKDPVFVGANSAKVDCTIAPQGDNLFAVIKIQIDKLLKQTKDKTKLAALKKREKSISDWANKCNHSLEARTKNMKARDKAVVTKTFHKAGIVVPVDSSGVGYRELQETDASLKKMLKKIVESETEDEKNRHSDSLQEIVTYVQFANDECDYGQGYELGIDLFSFGEEHFHSMIQMLLSVAYQLLGRDEFGDILKAHLKDRQRDNVSKIL